MANVEPQEIAFACARIADEKKADNIVVLRVAPVTTLADYFVIATGKNTRQIRAMAFEMESAAAKLKTARHAIEGTPDSGWVLLDLGDVIVHLFSPEARRLYALEVLWGDAEAEDWAEAGRKGK